MSRPQVPPAIQDCHSLLEWLIPQLDRFPRQRRFTLGDRIESLLLEVLQGLIEAAYRRGRPETLREANLKLDVARHLWRLSFRLQAVAPKSYAHGAELFTSLGRQIGGWYRHRAGSQHTS